MICSNCGTEIKNNETICPYCGYNNISINYISADGNSNQPNPQPLEPNGLQNSPKKTKNNKSTIIGTLSVVSIMVIALAVCIVCSLAGLYNMTNNTKTTNPTEIATEKPTEETAPLEINIEDYYISGGSVTYIADSNNPVPLTYTNENTPDSQPQTLTLDEDRYAFDGKAFYSQQGYEYNQLYKFTFIDKTTLVKSVWVTEDTLKDSILGKKAVEEYADGLYNWQYHNGYVYFINEEAIYDEEDFSSDHAILTDEQLPYRLGRISVDGKSVEFSKQLATEYAIKDDILYFYDNGITYVESKINEDKSKGATNYIDATRVGIYKMEFNGTNKELVKGDITIPDSYSEELCSNLTISGDYIYYIDNTPAGNKRVCRIKLDGSDFEYLTENHVFTYSVDESTQTLYYSLNLTYDTVGEKQKIKKTSIKDETITDIVAVDSIDNSTFKYYKNCLYFSNNYRFTNASKELATCGARFNFETNKIEYLQRYYEVEEVKDDIFTKQIVKGPYFYWEEATDNNKYFA